MPLPELKIFDPSEALGKGLAVANMKFEQGIGDMYTPQQPQTGLGQYSTNSYNPYQASSPQAGNPSGWYDGYDYVGG